jgi:hypothetical protein
MIKPPKVGAYFDLTELGEPKATLRDVVQLAKTINRTAGLTVLGQMNLALGAAVIKEDLNNDPDARWKTQELLIRTTISDRRLKHFKDKFQNVHLRDRIVFHRSQLFAAIKLVALFGDPVRGNALEARHDFDVLTELALAINSLSHERDLPKGALAVRHLAPLLAPSRELENLPRIDNAMVRGRRMLGPILSKKSWMPLADRLEQLFVFLTNGFSFEAFQDMLFGVFAYFQAVSTDSMQEFRRTAFLNPYAAGNIISGPLFEQFLRNMSVDIGEVPNAVGRVSDERSLMLDLTHFRARPVWRFAPDSYLCIDPCLLVEKLASGFYWTVNQALETADKNETARRRLQFSRLWGSLFEEYVFEQLRLAVPPESGRLFENVLYSDASAEAFDAIVLEDRSVVAFEIKGLFARAEEKYSGKFLPFFKGLSRKYGKQPGSAIQQLATNVQYIFGLPRRQQISAFPVREFRCVWPVVVVLEPILGLGLASRLLVERFMHRIRNITWQAFTSVRPVVFLSIEDLEVIAQHVREHDFSFVDCLREKLGEDPTHFYSFNDFYWGQFVPEHKIAFRRNALVADEYKELTDAAMDRFHDGIYQDCTSTPHGAVFKHG